MTVLAAATLWLGLPACDGGTEEIVPSCELDLVFEIGDDGHAEPLGAGPGEARAGRVTAAQLPPVDSGLITWAEGDFVLANDKIAVVIEDVGPSDLYDPWGGRLVGMARVEGGVMVEPADFGEFFLLTGRESLVTQSVSVLADGSDGGPAVVRAVGNLAPTPFFESVVGPLIRDTHEDIPTAIDYILEPGAEHIDVVFTYRSPRDADAVVPLTLHGYMYTKRMVTYAPGHGFDAEDRAVEYMAFIDDDATSYAYSVPEGGELGAGVSASGFVSNFGPAYTIAACAETVHHRARLTVGGPGVDGLRQAVARTDGVTLRAVTGTVRNSDGTPAEGVRVHAELADGGYVTRAMTDADGVYTLHVEDGVDVQLTAWRRGDAVAGPIAVSSEDPGADIDLAPTGLVRVIASDADTGQALPVRVQLLPVAGDPPSVPDSFGEPQAGSGRLHIEYAPSGQITLRAPEGAWRLVVSRGYEYDVFDEQITVANGTTVIANVILPRVVDTTGVMCADFHIHTHRSNDSGDDGADKVAAAAADGLEIPVRSEHEFVQGFESEIAELGLEDWAFGVSSVEMTSFEAWGHMGVLPLQPRPGEVNAGAPLWQRYPSAEQPEVPVETRLPPEVFAEVRERPEQPVIIINHPRSGSNYFDIAGYDPITGLPDMDDYWDEEFGLLEVFNDNDWVGTFSTIVTDWLSLLSHGRRVFAVGSSDSHALSRSPVGYPRTCLDLGTDDPRALTPELIRDVTAAGHSTISGGIYVNARVGSAGPGDDVVGAAPVTPVRVTVQAALWIDVDFLDVVVDGEVVDTISILPGDADPTNPVVRFDADIDVPVAPGAGSFAIFAAYGDAPLEPVHPGRIPFGVTNPIFLQQ